MKGFKLWTIMDGYVARQLFWIVVFAISLFSVIVLAPNILYNLIQDVFGGSITPLQGLFLFVNEIPTALQQAIPIAVLLGSIVLFQRLSQDYEFIAMVSSGISPRRVLWSVLAVGMLFAGFQAVVQEWVLPHTANRLERMYTELDLRDIQDRNFLFVEKDHHDRLAKFFMIGQIQKPQLSDFVVLYYVDSGGYGVRISRILRAKSGRWVPESKQWLLTDGIEYVLNDEGVYKDIRPFREQQVRTNRYASLLLDYTRLNPMTMPWGQLKRYIKLLREGAQLQEVPYHEVRLWQKWSTPIATMIFAVLGAMLGMERIRTNRAYGLAFGALIIFIYSILVPFTSNLGSLNLVAPWLMAWLPLFVVIVLAALLMELRPRQG